ncbi:MAG: hypothetical protein KatS3mg077_0649 [Candidatus Binatia bacterium]|nr:MAG: hypothetical protein KatS3mg077_0649 [Candidatus Binatia bacterium]
MRVRPVREGLFVTDSSSGEVCLLGSECRECATLAFPASDYCPYCGGFSTRVTRLPRQGVVELCTVVQRPSAGYAGPLPYALAVVRLCEDLKIIAPIATGQMVPPGTRVECALQEVGKGDDGAILASYCFRACAGEEKQPALS